MHDDPVDDPVDDGRSTPVAARAMFRRKGRWPVVIAGDDEEHFAIDLSLGGLFLKDVSAYENGARLTLTVGLTDGLFTTAATVRWVRPERMGPMMEAGMGVLFEDLSDSDRVRLENEIQPGEPR